MGLRLSRRVTGQEGETDEDPEPRLEHECINRCASEEWKEKKHLGIVSNCRQEKDYRDKNAIDLVALLNGDADATDALHYSLRNHGWQVVKTPPEFQAIVGEYEQDVKRFFEQSQERKLEHRHGLYYGYKRFERKEVYRVMSGSDLPDASVLPPHLLHSMPRLIDLLETTLVRLHEVLGLSASEDEIPMLRRPGDPRGRFALFDAAHYFNDDTAAENCASHYDPGLLTLSVLSTARGLQLYRNHVWHHAPLGRDRAVIWAGYAARIVDPRIQPAIHRVGAVEGESRHSAWMELCTEKQALPYHFGHYPVRSGSDTRRAVKVGSKLSEGYIIVPNLSPEAEDGAEYRVQLKNGSVMETLHMVEMLLGLPRSKVMVEVHYDNDGTVRHVGPE